MLLLLAASCCFLLTSATLTKDDVVSKTERDLRRDLFQDYDKKVRPVLHPTNVITVSTSISPLAIREYDEKNQILVLESWMGMKWNDDYMKWDPMDYSNITDLRLPHTEVWKPDLSVYGASPESSMFPTSPTNMIVFNTGQVMWVPSFTIRSRCPMTKLAEKSYLTCNIQIGSWTYSGNLLDPQLLTTEVDLTNFQDSNPDWKLLNVKSNRVSRFYPCCPEDYPLLNFNVTLKRRGPVSKIDAWQPMKLHQNFN